MTDRMIESINSNRKAILEQLLIKDDFLFHFVAQDDFVFFQNFAPAAERSEGIFVHEYLEGTYFLCLGLNILYLILSPRARIP